MSKHNTLVKIRVFPSHEDDLSKNPAYEGRFIGFVDNIMFRLLTKKTGSIRRVSSIETASLEEFVNNGKSIKGNRLLFALKNKNEKPIYNTLFITEKIDHVTQISHVHSATNFMKKGTDVNETLIEKVKVVCLGKNKTRFILTEFYKF